MQNRMSISDLRVEARTRIPVTVASETGHILSTGSSKVQFHSAPINNDLVILNRSAIFPTDPKKHLFIVMHFADGKFAFTSYKGTASEFVVAPKAQRGMEASDGHEYFNSFYDKNVAERIRRAHWTSVNTDQLHPERPVMVTIIAFDKAAHRDLFAAKYIADIVLSRNLNCLNHRSYTWLGPEAASNDQRSERTASRNQDRRERLAIRVADDQAASTDDTTIYKLFNMGSLVANSGTRAQLAQKNRLTLSDVNDLIAGEFRRGWKLYAAGDKKKFRQIINDRFKQKMKELH